MEPQSAPNWVKNTSLVSGLLLMMVGWLSGMGLCCSVGRANAFTILTVVASAAGTIMFWHGIQALNRRPSHLIVSLPAGVLVGAFALFMLFIALADQEWLYLDLVWQTFILLAGSLPPLAAVTWFFAGRPGRITWRTGLVSLATGASGAVLLAILLEALLPGILFVLVSSLDTTGVERVLSALSDNRVAAAITDPSFVLLLLQLAVVAPLAEEIAKPLFTIPIIKNHSRRDSFLIGALAGAGFAMVENAVYASVGYHLAAGVLLVRAIGCALHPLGSGLMALGWRDWLQGRAGAGSRWWQRFGAAAGLHALWNGGSLLIITLAGAEFLGELPPELDLLGVSAAGTTLAFLIILGLAALWLGRRIANPSEQAPEFDTTISDRAAALWALTCLLALVPLGITGLKLLLR